MAKDPLHLAFEAVSLRIALSAIVPRRTLPASTRLSAKYAQIAASINEVGIIEPPVVVRDRAEPGLFHLLDGHIRFDIVATQGAIELVCLIATDDEAFTYNKHVGRVATLQEHRMILNAIDQGVPEERLARALNVNIGSIRQKKTLTSGLCREVIDLLKDRQIPINTIGFLKRMKSLRQIQAVELMMAMNVFSVSYARSLFAATPAAQRVKGKKPIRGLSDRQLKLMEAESANLELDFKVVEQGYGTDHLDLVLAAGYVTKLLGNVRVVRYLAQHYPDILMEFQRVSEVQRAA